MTTPPKCVGETQMNKAPAAFDGTTVGTKRGAEPQCYIAARKDNKTGCGSFRVKLRHGNSSAG